MPKRIRPKNTMQRKPELMPMRTPTVSEIAISVAKEQVAEYIAKTPPVTEIDVNRSSIGKGNGWANVFRFMKQGYRIVMDSKGGLKLHRPAYKIECEGWYTFPERTIYIVNTGEINRTGVNKFMSLYADSSSYEQGDGGRTVTLDYCMQRVPCDNGVAWRMVVVKS